MRSESEILVRLGIGNGLHPGAAFGVVVLLLAALVVLYLPTAQSMAVIWTRSDTFAHGWLVLPASLWFAWRRREQLAAVAPRPFLLGLIAVAGGGLLWLLGELSSSAAPSQFGLVALAAAAALTLFGWRWFRVLSFPLGFLVFAVPFGEAFMPALMDWTADFTVAGLRSVGVPVLREGNDLTIPTGRWSVVEACSGVRYLLASATAGVLYAWTMFQSPLRRAIFIGASIAAPIAANWLRAFMIVMLGHLSDNRIAAGVDHLIYGWVFFGVIIATLFWAGSFWYESARPLPRRSVPVEPAPPLSSLLPTAVLLLIAVAVWPAAARALLEPQAAALPALPALTPTAGWRPVADAETDWQPLLERPRLVVSRNFERDGRRVTLVLGLYRNQQQGSELVNSMNRLVGPIETGWRQMSRDREWLTVPAHGEVELATARLRSRNQELTVLHWYWIGERWTARDTIAKLDLALDRLLGRDDTSAWVVVAAVHDPSQPQAATTLLRAFVTDMAPSLDAALGALVARR